jgi:hypothetical protein
VKASIIVRFGRPALARLNAFLDTHRRARQ